VLSLKSQSGGEERAQGSEKGKGGGGQEKIDSIRGDREIVRTLPATSKCTDRRGRQGKTEKERDPRGRVSKTMGDHK